MKTTLNIDDGVFTQLKREAAEQGRTMSELVESALRSMFSARQAGTKLRPLPSASMGTARVDVANRDALYDLMEKDA